MAERVPSGSSGGPGRTGVVGCAAPASTMYLDPNGDVRVCCQNDWNRIGNVATASLREIWHGARVRRIREAVRVGDFSLGCELCAEQARIGGPEAQYARTYDHLAPVESDPEWPRQLELALSNTCNLECVMCNGELSSAIRRRREHRPPLEVVYGEAFFAELDEFLPHLRSVGFVGGEPFLARESLRVLDRLVELGLRPHCTVTTNGTQWNERIARFPTALPMHIGVSLDALDPDLLRSIRVGIDPDRVRANLTGIRATLDSTGGTMSILFSPMRANAHEMVAMARFASRLDADLVVNHVSHPSHLSLVHAPGEEIDRLVDVLTSQLGDVGDLGRNRHVVERELSSIRGLGRGRSATPVRLGPRRDQASHGSDGPRPALLKVDRSMLISEVVEGDVASFGLQLADLVGQPLGAVVGTVCGALGETLSTEMRYLDDGSESRTFRFGRGNSVTSLTAVMTMGDDGGQEWRLHVGAEDDAGLRTRSGVGGRRSIVRRIRRR